MENQLFFGIDRLELYCEGLIDSEVYESIEKLSNEAKEKEQDIECEDLGCVVLWKSFGRFPIALRWKQCLLRVGAMRSESKQLEPVTMETEGSWKRENLKGDSLTHRCKADFFSEYCNQRNLEELQRDTRDILETLFCRIPSSVKISRVDVARDTFHNFKRSDKKRLVTHSRKIAEYETERTEISVSGYSVGSTFTGFVIGADSKRLRIYNKTEEIRQKKTQSRYSATYQNRKKPVWRIEFQLRRGKNWDLYHHNFSTTIPFLWTQLTTLTRFCEVGKNKQRNRWKTADFWSTIQEATPLGIGYKPKEQKQRVAEIETLFSQAFGVLQKAAALEGIETSEEIIKKMLQSMDKRGKQWTQGLHKKKLETLQADKLLQTTPLELRNRLLEQKFEQ